jgi:type IV pilus assembly protein PilF
MKKFGKIVSVVMMAILLGACASDKAAKKGQSEALRQLGEAYMGQKEYTKALREFKKAEEIYPKDPLLHDDMGLTYMAKGSPDQAIEHFEEALDIEPDYTPALNNLGTAYMEKEDWQSAIECFLKAKDDMLYLTPHYPLSNLGFAYYKLQEYDKSVLYYKEAIELKSDFPKAHHGLGLTYMAMGNYDEAIKSLERAIEVVPKEAQIYLDLGKAYKLNNDFNKAYQSFKKAESLAEKPQLKKEAGEEAQTIWNLK